MKKTMKAFAASAHEAHLRGMVEPHVEMEYQETDRIRQAMCPKSGGKIDVCMVCPARCKAGNIMIDRVGAV